ncbi:MAG: type II toxin-antitoxin system VapC family toxin [Dehalococcoidia bacterium]
MNSSGEILDASAVLALVQHEPGWQRVDAALTGHAVMSTVNLAEVVTRLAETGDSESDIHRQLRGIAVEFQPFDTDLAYRCGLLRPATRHLGLSLGDRACLALAQKLDLPVLTADRAWASLSLGITINTIR